ncbi:spore coat protein GerQ [Virgibacillus ihumii]|uniref:spore coat protein GerQ n=1 Tax=Virgibacillus ihumii TaxID=2686091 RepID=UPI00157BCE58|nr:spore coat protein GerQ [Virgibacillus ihumii]
MNPQTGTQQSCKSVDQAGQGVTQVENGMGGYPPVNLPPSAEQSPTQNQQFIVDALRRHTGDFVRVSMSFNNTDREFKGTVQDVGMDHVTLEDERLNSRVILPLIFVNYIEIPK